MVESVSFDVWGTLLDLDKTLQEASRVIAEALGAPFETVYSRVLKAHEEARKVRRSSLIPGNETVKTGQAILAKHIGVDPSGVDSLIHKAFQEVDPHRIVYDDVVETVEGLYKEGLRLAVAGNVLFWPSSYTWRLLERLGLGKFFEARVFSDEVGYNKPDRGFFIALLERLGVEPGAVVHVGDNVIEDVGGPMSMGMKAVLIRRDSKLTLSINLLGVAVVYSLRQLPSVIRLI